MAYLSSTQNSEGFGDIVAYEMPDEQQEDEIIEEELVVEEIKEETTPKDSVVRVLEEDFKVQRPPVISKIAITFQILDKRTEARIDAQVTFNWNNKEVAVNTGTLGTEDNKFVLNFDEGAEVKTKIEAQGFLIYEETFVAAARASAEISDSTKISAETFYLTPEEVGTVVKIENVLFNRASSQFSNPIAAKKEIDELINLMKANPGMAIRLEGHTDNRGYPKLLVELSEERVKTVRRYMITRGISGSRIDFIGYGGNKPLLDDDSPEAREINRRVEFVIIK